MTELHHRVLDRFGMAANWIPSIIVKIFKGKGNMTFSCNRAVKLLEHDMKVEEMVFQTLYKVVIVITI